MTVTIEPFLLEPELKERIWGGTRLGAHAPPYGEAWIVGDQNRISTGSAAGQTLAELAAAHPVELLGAPVCEAHGSQFPLLIKLLDPADWLSIQVHPDDLMAQAIEGAGYRGKTEAWFVLDAEPGSELIAGVRPGVQPGQVADAIQNGTLGELLQHHEVQGGDALLIEAGLIHALGPGLFIYEVQQSSDLTYRVSDWGRPASAGRKLHIDESIQASKPALQPRWASQDPANPESPSRLLECAYFALDLVDSAGEPVEMDTGKASFHAVTVINGSADLIWNDRSLRLGHYQSAIVSADAGPYRLIGDGRFRALVSKVP